MSYTLRNIYVIQNAYAISTRVLVPIIYTFCARHKHKGFYHFNYESNIYFFVTTS